jgi:hypothetical protein
MSIPYLNLNAMYSIPECASPSLSLKSDYTSDCWANVSDTLGLEGDTPHDSHYQDAALALQEDLGVLRGTISHITRLMINCSSVPAWVIAGVLFDKWVLDHQGIIRGPWLCPTGDHDPLKTLCESLHVYIKEEPAPFSLGGADHESPQGRLCELFQIADGAKNRCKEAFMHLNGAAIMAQHRMPEFGLDYIKFSPVYEYQPAQAAFVTGLGDLVTVGKLISDAILGDDSALGIGQDYKRISSVILQMRDLVTTLEGRTYIVSLQRLYWDPDLINAQLNIEQLRVDIKRLEAEKTLLFRKHITKDSDKQFKLLNETFRIL